MEQRTDKPPAHLSATLSKLSLHWALLASSFLLGASWQRWLATVAAHFSFLSCWEAKKKSCCGSRSHLPTYLVFQVASSRQRKVIRSPSLPFMYLEHGMQPPSSTLILFAMNGSNAGCFPRTPCSYFFQREVAQSREHEQRGGMCLLVHSCAPFPFLFHWKLECTCASAQRWLLGMRMVWGAGGEDHTACHQGVPQNFLTGPTGRPEAQGSAAGSPVDLGSGASCYQHSSLPCLALLCPLSTHPCCSLHPALHWVTPTLMALLALRLYKCDRQEIMNWLRGTFQVVLL